jgi:hypothetical protein
MKVVLTRAGGPLEDRLVPCLLQAGHDVRVLAAPEGIVDRRSLPTGVRPIGGVADADAVLVVIGRLEGVRSDELDQLDALAGEVSATGRAKLVVVARSHVSRVEAILTRHDDGAAWTTLQGVTALHDDVAALFARRAHGRALTVPNGVALQPVDPAEVADRVVRLLRAEPAGRVPDFGGPSIRLVDDLACAWLRWRDADPDAPIEGAGERCRVEVVDPDVDGTIERWPGAWLTPKRTVGAIEFETWLEHRRSASAAEAVQRGDQPVGAGGGSGGSGPGQQG